MMVKYLKEDVTFSNLHKVTILTSSRVVYG